MYGAQCDSVAILLTVEGIVHVLVEEVSLGGQPVVGPLLLDMNQSPLPGTEHKVLNPRQHQHFVVGVHGHIK